MRQPGVPPGPLGGEKKGGGWGPDHIPAILPDRSHKAPNDGSAQRVLGPDHSIERRL